jgi:N-acetylglucosaminyldiphosphoundecaprenol N-acetyl-beta-D-mannosaminyltransferase
VKRFKHVDILGYSILDEPAPLVAAAVCDDLEGNCRESFVFLNPHSVVIAEHEPAFRSAIVNADGVFCDGVGLSMAALLLNRRRVVRVYGFEFFSALSRELSARKMGRVFFLGGTEGVLDQLMRRYRADFPGVAAVGGFAPPFKIAFGDADIEEMARRVVAFDPEVLWVGLGSPKQEKVLLELMRRCDVRCAAAVGAVFDFYTDRIPHAPAWIRRAGLQWVHRLILEPRRLWKRTLVSSPMFLWLVFRQLLSSPGGSR